MSASGIIALSAVGGALALTLILLGLYLYGALAISNAGEHNSETGDEKMTDDEKRTAIFEKLSEYIGKSVAIKIHTLSGKTIELTGELTWDILNKRDVANSFKIEFAEFYSVDGIYIHPENIDEVKILK